MGLIKRFAGCVLALCVLFVSGGVLAAGVQKANVNKQDVKLRVEASADAEVITRLRGGAEVTVISKQDKWIYVSYGNDKGYIREEMLDIKSMPRECVGKGKINADETNLRVKPYVNAKIVMQLKKGTAVEISERIDNWYLISVNKSKGYVRKDYIDIIAITSEESDTDSDYDVYKMGMSGTPIAKIQSALQKLKYFSGEVNGSYGAVTREAVKAFQAANGLKENGVADAETQRVIFELLYAPAE